MAISYDVGCFYFVYFIHYLRWFVVLQKENCCGCNSLILFIKVAISFLHFYVHNDFDAEGDNIFETMLYR